MQLHADIVLPGLETSSAEYAGQQPSFVDSFEDFSLPRLPSTRSSSRKATPRPTSPQPKLPGSVKLTRRHVDRSPRRKPAAAANQHNSTPRLRHDDSQVHFAAIEPSSAIGSPLESQVLTERQKEVRDRQRENAALFPEVQSSPGVKPQDFDRQTLPVDTRPRQTTTPEPERGFDDYVSSTPTPRRGQMMVMLEHDMTDPPSSPPELRGNPLAAEIRSRSASHSLLEEWQFSSSPVSGSPNPSRHGIVPDPSGQRGYVSVVSLPEVEDVGSQVPSSPAKRGDTTAPELPAEEVIEDSMIFVPAEAASVPEPSSGPVAPDPSTPRRSARFSRTHGRETPTPKSEGEEFVDAPTSPLPPTPGQAKRTGKATPASEETKERHAPITEKTSFDLSEVDEKSLLRLVVELDSTKTDRSEYHRPSPPVSPDDKGQRSPVIDCIVVGDSPKKAEVPPLPRRTRASSAASAMSSNAEPPIITGSQPKPRVGRQKRKRASSKAQEASPKRQRHDSVEESEEGVGSQVATAQGASVEVQASGEVQQATSKEIAKEEGLEERIPSSSAEPSGSEGAGDESVSQGSPVAGTGDAMDVEEDDQDVQSQIALEFSHSQRQDEQSVSASGEASAQEPMQVDIQQPTLNKEGKEEVAGKEVEPARAVEEAVAPEANHARKIMNLFRSGLDELRLARLSREEVYQIEDMFMDMKRELYEAERRGRT